ncbi:hypothetical protein [Cohnella abietis]|uniref:Uncharacterized protein n=1 Tax=Cohnella abietis TaxID=2507935 RepID=A0A3T1D3T8_9BACL|nr:hypothetical protein [Cohnella abietis]BBI32786.1 hypothetical protein KCTCHS21_21850 [Cohnella abietis]
MVQRIRRMGSSMKFSTLSLISVGAVLLLHLAHLVSASFLAGTSVTMHSHHGEAGGNSPVMEMIKLAVYVGNAISIYFAVRQLAFAWKNRGSSTFHTYLCSAISILVLVIGIGSFYIL